MPRVNKLSLVGTGRLVRGGRLVRSGGSAGFLKSLVRDLMSLRGPAQLCQLVRPELGLGTGSQPAAGRFAPLQLPANPLAVGRVNAQALVVKRAEQPAAPQANDETDGGEQGQDQADTDTQADAALAHLMSLDLALLVQGQDADGVMVRHSRFLQSIGRRIG